MCERCERLESGKRQENSIKKNLNIVTKHGDLFDNFVTKLFFKLFNQYLNDNFYFKQLDWF